MRRTATTSLEAFYGTPAQYMQDREKQVLAAFTSHDVTYTRQQLVGVAELPINSICGRVRSLLDKDALVVRGELRCANTGKYRELLGLPKEGCA